MSRPPHSAAAPGLLAAAPAALLAALALAAAASSPADSGDLEPAAADEPRSEREAHLRDALYAPHRDAEGLFFAPWDEPSQRLGGARSLLRFMRWQLARNSYDKSRDPEIPVVANDGAYLQRRDEPASLTWIGHASYAIHDGGDVVLTDPIWGERALIPKRITPPGLPIEQVPGDAFAVISHSHYDHLDAETIETLPDTIGWYVPLGLAKWVRDRGARDVTELDWWESARRGRWTITCLPSQHWSRRLGQVANQTLWCSWMLESGERRYYFAGDTGYFHGFAEFGRRFGKIDAALLPIGAYEPRWFMAYQHMDPAQAYQAYLDLGARHFFALHWGTFDLTDEPLDLPPRELRAVIREAGASMERIHIPAIGERVLLPTP